MAFMTGRSKVWATAADVNQAMLPQFSIAAAGLKVEY
jgi:hypothetical protein